MRNPEVVVIGGGPAGSSCAILLAMRGHRVVLLERDSFPRFMIGESLLPAAWDLWDRLGVRDRIEDAGYPVKRGVLFRIEDTEGFHEFLIRTDEFPQYFVRPFTFHVDRAHFDRMLLTRAREVGVDVRERHNVKDVIFDGSRATGVSYLDPVGQASTIEAPVVVDASGRRTLLATKLGRRYANPDLVKAAYYAHFEGAGRRLADDGSTVTDIHSTEGGWIWYIPLRRDVVSVGVVLDTAYVQAAPRGRDELFRHAVQNDDQISAWLSGARQCFEIKAIPSISYLSHSFVGDGFLMVGDAAMFIDPIFSAGVMLAMRGAEFAAEVISRGLRSGDVSSETFLPYEKRIRKPIAKMHKIITNWYDIMASRDRNHIFRLSQQAPLMREQLVVLLSGGYDKADMDVFLRETNSAALPG